MYSRAIRDLVYLRSRESPGAICSFAAADTFRATTGFRQSGSCQRENEGNDERRKEESRLPGMQTQRKVPGSSRHEPSFWQGWDSHSFTFVSHLGPVNPWAQLQANEPGVFTQMPSCSHGDPRKDSEKNNLAIRTIYRTFLYTQRRTVLAYNFVNHLISFNSIFPSKVYRFLETFLFTTSTTIRNSLYERIFFFNVRGIPEFLLFDLNVQRSVKITRQVCYKEEASFFFFEMVDLITKHTLEFWHDAK